MLKRAYLQIFQVSYGNFSEKSGDTLVPQEKSDFKEREWNKHNAMLDWSEGLGHWNSKTVQQNKAFFTVCLCCNRSGRKWFLHSCPLQADFSCWSNSIFRFSGRKISEENLKVWSIQEDNSDCKDCEFKNHPVMLYWSKCRIRWNSKSVQQNRTINQPWMEERNQEALFYKRFFIKRCYIGPNKNSRKQEPSQDCNPKIT